MIHSIKLEVWVICPPLKAMGVAVLVGFMVAVGVSVLVGLGVGV